jgi:hypothetical protein
VLSKFTGIADGIVKNLSSRAAIHDKNRCPADPARAS